MTMRLDVSKLENVKRTPDGIICACPACRAEGSDKGRDNLKVFTSGAYHCIKHGSDDPEHSRIIRNYLRGTSLEDNPEEEYFDPEPKLTIEKIYPESVLDKLIPDYTYWVGRGIKESVLRALECGVAAKEERSKLSGRSIFPVRNLEGRIVGFSGRLLEQNSYAPKYKHMFKVKSVCWPWNVSGAHIKRTGAVVLTEGASDLVKLLSHEIPNVIALFGLNINGKIIASLVAANVRKIFISTNRDEDPNKGQRAAEVIKNKLCAFFPEDSIIIRLPPEGVKDWMDASDEQIGEFRQEVQS